MDSTVTLKGITFTVKRWGESDLYTLECPHCHPGVDFAKGDTVEVDGTFYLVYLVGDRSINLQRMYPVKPQSPMVGHVDFGRTTLTAAVLFTQNPPAPLPEGTTAAGDEYGAPSDPAVQPVTEAERRES